MNKNQPTITSCKFCGKNSFSEPVSFRGTTNRYHSSYFLYARCLNCHSICNLSINDPDYSDYVTGERTSWLKIKRFTTFLHQLNITKNKSLVDYGCGRGALLLELNKRGYKV